MNKCTDCINETTCKGNRRKGSHTNCFQPKVKDFPSYLDNPKTIRKQTNFERIKSMSVKEMAEFISHFSDGYHTPSQNKKRRKEMKKWLKMEVEENDK